MNNTTPSVSAAARVVERLAAEPDGMAQAPLAKALGLSPSTCYRILRSLAEHGWVRKDARGVWRLGSGLVSVAAALRAPLERIDAAGAVLRRVAAEHGIACKLSLRRGDEQVVAARAEPSGPVQATGREGAAFPVTEGSSGAALLADLADDEAEALVRDTPAGQTDAAFLRASLAALRARGWCSRQRIQGWPIAALSAPVRDVSGSVFASLSFLVPEARLADPSLPPLLLATARECGAA